MTERLLLVADGRSNKEIGEEITLAEKTVKNYMSSVLNKLEVARRAEAMGYYTMSQSLGTAIAPAIGIDLLSRYGAVAAFSVSALLGVAAFVAAVRGETPIGRSPAWPSTASKYRRMRWIGSLNY